MNNAGQIWVSINSFLSQASESDSEDEYWEKLLGAYCDITRDDSIDRRLDSNLIISYIDKKHL